MPVETVIGDKACSGRKNIDAAKDGDYELAARLNSIVTQGRRKKPRMTYFFDVEKCKRCPYKEGCYKEGAKKKTYTETIICDSHSEQAKFQETKYFSEKAKERYKIEAKNSELKHRHVMM